MCCSAVLTEWTAMQFVETECNRILYCVLYCTVLYCTLFCAALLMRGAALYCKVLYKRWEAMLQRAPAKYVCTLYCTSQRLCLSRATPLCLKHRSRAPQPKPSTRVAPGVPQAPRGRMLGSKPARQRDQLCPWWQSRRSTPLVGKSQHGHASVNPCLPPCPTCKLESKHPEGSCQTTSGLL